MFAILSFFYGASLGSFTQVLVTRLHVAPVFTSRSKCLSCGEKIHWFDLIPILSYLVLRGKCRVCKSSFGVASLVIEALFGAVFVGVYLMVLEGRGVTPEAFSWLLYYTVLIILLGAITLYDLRHKVIPNILFFFFLLLSLGTMLFSFAETKDIYTLMGPLVVALPFGLAYVITKGRALGFGDILMYLAVGAFFGIWQGLAVLFLSVWIGGAVAIVLHYANRKTYTMKTALPFVPFITLAFFIVLFTQMDISSIGQMLTWWYY